MAVQARFYVAEVTRYANAAVAGYASPAPRGVVVMRQVTRGDHNKAWATATPQAELRMTVNGDAFGWFDERVGAELAITIDDRPEHELE